MDTYAAVRQLEQADFSTAQAEAITRVVQEATAHTPPPELRQRLGLQPDPWRTRPYDESQILARCEAIQATLAHVRDQLDAAQRRVTAPDARLAGATRLAWAMVGLAAALLVAVAVWR